MRNVLQLVGSEYQGIGLARANAIANHHYGTRITGRSEMPKRLFSASAAFYAAVIWLAALAVVFSQDASRFMR